MRSTLRRYAMATPASVHCMSRQLVFGDLSCTGFRCVRSTLRRYAMATPASVHCMSRQLVFGDLSCTGFRRKTWHPRHHKLFTIHRIISHWIACSACSSWIFWIWIFRSYGFGPGREPTRRLRHWHRIIIVSHRFHVDVVHVVQSPPADVTTSKLLTLVRAHSTVKSCPSISADISASSSGTPSATAVAVTASCDSTANDKAPRTFGNTPDT